MEQYEIHGIQFTADDILNPDDREFSRRVYLVTEAVGFSTIVRGIVIGAKSEQDALDELADADRLQPILEEDYSDYGVTSIEPICAFLGNDSQPYDLDHIGIQEIDLSAIAGALSELDNRKTYDIGTEFGRTHLPVTVSEAPVYCPNASTLGYGLTHAEPGFYLALEPESYGGDIARVLGRIESTPDKSMEGYILTLVLAQNGRHAFERWINPKDVRECYASSPAALWQFFTADLPNPRTTIALASHGTLSANYAENIPERITELESRLKEREES